MWCYKKGLETEEYGDRISDTASVDGIKRVLIKLSIDDYSLLEDFYLGWISKIEYKFDTEHCPKCGGRFTPIIYGYIAGDGLFEEEEKGNVILGGCTVYEDSPTHYCKNCDEGFQFRSNGLKINYEPKTRQYHYVEKIKYVIDSCSLNELEYKYPNHISVFEPIYTKLNQMFEDGELFSVREVFEELKNSQDYWEDYEECFRELTGSESEKVTELLGDPEFSVFVSHGMNNTDGCWADPYLVACAMEDSEVVIVSQESLRREPQRKIPYICEQKRISVVLNY